MTKFWKFPSVKRTMGDREEPSPKRRGRRTIQLPHPEALLDSTGNPIASSSNQEVMSQELNPNLNKETYPILEDPNKMPVEELSKPSTNEASEEIADGKDDPKEVMATEAIEATLKDANVPNVESSLNPPTVDLGDDKADPIEVMETDADVAKLKDVNVSIVGSSPNPPIVDLAEDDQEIKETESNINNENQIVKNALKPTMETSPNPPAVDAAVVIQSRAENEDNILDDEESDEIYNQVVEQMNREEADDQQTPGSYGYAAAKRKKLSYPYAVYIHRGTRDRQQLPRPIFNAFEKFLWDSRETIDAEENEKIKIEWLCHMKGIGIVICLDSFTAAFVKKLAATFSSPTEGQTIRGWSKWERSSAILFKFYVHSVYIKSLKPETAINKILKMNKLEGDFVVNRWDKKSQNGVFCEIEPKGKLLLALANKKRLRAPSCTIILDKRIRKQMSELEFVESAKKFEAN